MITIETCVFAGHPEKKVTYGYKCYDEDNRIYNDLWTQNDIERPRLEVLQAIYLERKGNRALELMFEHIIDNQLDIRVGETLIITWEELSKQLGV